MADASGSIVLSGWHSDSDFLRAVEAMEVIDPTNSTPKPIMIDRGTERSMRAFYAFVRIRAWNRSNDISATCQYR
jgi:hypothetical protein